MESDRVRYDNVVVAIRNLSQREGTRVALKSLSNDTVVDSDSVALRLLFAALGVNRPRFSAASMRGSALC